MQTFISILEAMIVTFPVLIAIAFTTVAERKTMASMQRRVGPNLVGTYGSLQAFADALKLLLKEFVLPAHADKILFFLAPIITLVFSLLGYGVIPYGAGLMLGDLDLGVLYTLAVSSLSAYGILLAGWAANSKYAFLGALRSTAQLISYELILSSAILLVVISTSTLNLTGNVECQRIIFFLLPILPIFIMFFTGSIAETNRAPFDLAEAESELVSGYMTEHSSVVFVFFFLAEYGSILLICVFTTTIFIGGYLLPVIIYPLIEEIKTNGLTWHGFTLGLKGSLMIVGFIWVRASFPRVRYDQLMSFCWTILLPIIISLIILQPSMTNFSSLMTLISFDGTDEATITATTSTTATTTATTATTATGTTTNGVTGFSIRGFTNNIHTGISTQTQISTADVIHHNMAVDAERTEPVKIINTDIQFKTGPGYQRVTVVDIIEEIKKA